MMPLPPTSLPAELAEKLDLAKHTLFVGKAGSGKTWALQAYLRLAVARQPGTVTYAHSAVPTEWRSECSPSWFASGIQEGGQVVDRVRQVVRTRLGTLERCETVPPDCPPQPTVCPPLMVALDGSLPIVIRQGGQGTRDTVADAEYILKIGRTVGVAIVAAVARLELSPYFTMAMRDQFTQVVYCERGKDPTLLVSS